MNLFCNCAYNIFMKKTDAISKFGSATKLARAIGITPQAVIQWPEELSPALNDRVIAALVRAHGTVPEDLSPSEEVPA